MSCPPALRSGRVASTTVLEGSVQAPRVFRESDSSRAQQLELRAQHTCSPPAEFEQDLATPAHTTVKSQSHGIMALIVSVSREGPEMTVCVGLSCWGGAAGLNQRERDMENERVPCHSAWYWPVN